MKQNNEEEHNKDKNSSKKRDKLAVSHLRSQSVKPIEAQRPTLSRQELESVLDCLIQDKLGSGQIASRLEKAFATAFGYKHVLAVHSLASAYHLSMLALQIKKDDNVLMSAIAPVQAADATRYVDASIEILDIERNSFHPSDESIQNTVNEKNPSLYIMHHAFGSPDRVNINFLKEKNIKIIEDITGLVGSEKNGEFFGNAGNIAVCGMSEYDLITTGNGALIITSDSKLYQAMLSLRYGSKRTTGPAYDYRLEDFQAAMGLDQLSRLEQTLSRRKKIGQKYLETLRLTKHETYFKEAGIDSYIRFPVIINKSHDEVEHYFRSLQIGIERAVDHPLHHLLGYPRLEFPNAERLYQKAVSIPVYPALTANNVERIASSLRGIL